MRRTTANLNTDWLYRGTEQRGADVLDCDESTFAQVSLPHAVRLPHLNPSKPGHSSVCWYRRRFTVPADAAGRRIFLDFDGVLGAAIFFFNGKPTGPERDRGYAPVSFDVTDLVNVGRENLLSVRVSSAAHLDGLARVGAANDARFCGIFRDVALRVVDPIYIKDIFAVPKDVLEERKSVDITATIVNTTDEEIELDLNASIGGGAATISGDLELPARGEARITFGIPGLEAQLWDPDHPTLYEAAVELEGGDRLSTRIGFRSVEFDGETLRLNGQPVELRGVHRCESFPHLGPAAPARLQVRDALVLKQDLECNVVLASQPPSRHFLDACDELGLLVIADLSGWPQGDVAGEEVALQNLRATIERDRNRPSIVLWGVPKSGSLGESDAPDPRVGGIVRQLDPTRPLIAISGPGSAGRLTMTEYIPGLSAEPAKVMEGGVPAQLIVEADDSELDADGADMTRVALRVSDASGNVVPATEPIDLRLAGPGVLIGDNPVPMTAGQGAVYLRATRAVGRIILTAAARGLAEQSISIDTLECPHP